MSVTGHRKANGSVELAGTPSHLLRRCYQYFGDLFVQQSGDKDLTRQQYLVLTALDQHDGASQTTLVEATGIDRSTLAEMVRRMLARELVSRSRTETDARANAIFITPLGRRTLRSARLAAERAERSFLEPLPPSERIRFVKSLALIASAADQVPIGNMGRHHRKASIRSAGLLRRV
ncbi:MAG TPA: MarR family transcriptional regulator [Rhizomicrobium sp.]|jgi:DNA-binding MarR family transcriptional regulator|nr:MarR family transcriptional regulator [Rhizomicrobium sp.]